MKNPNDNFFQERWRSIFFALRGVIFLIKSEDSIKVQLFIAFLVSIAGFYFEISITEWMIQFLAIGLVLVAEALNTGIEKIADFVHPEFHKKIGFIKDVSAGAAAFAGFISLIVAGLICIPKIALLF